MINKGSKDIYVLGLSASVVATAALLKNGRILDCVSEERFNKKKSCLGYPKLAVEYLIKNANISTVDLDLVVDSMAYGLFPSQADTINQKTRPINFVSILTLQIGQIYGTFRNLLSRVEYSFPWLKITEGLNRLVREPGGRLSQKLRRQEMVNHLKIDPNKIIFVDHHTTHTFSAFALDHEEPALIFSLDGMGDYLSATISRQSGKKIERLSVTPHFSSLGWVYTMVTQYLKMKPHEHEYKVMGLAPYADKSGSEKVAKILKRYLYLSPRPGHETEFESLYPFNLFEFYLKEKLAEFRFDLIAGGVQIFAEDLMVEWIRKGLEKFGEGIKSVVLTGGVFMNVKANKKIMEIPEIQRLYIVPSAGDESTPIGAAFWGYKKLALEKGLEFNPQPLENLYLGPSYDKNEIEKDLQRLEVRKMYQVEYVENIEEKIAQLLFEVKIVARMAGRMEFGARALGNRSILARADDPDVVQIINEQIKNRDFWMPFAGTILYERRQDYLVNPKDVDGPFMILSYDSTSLAQKHMKAAMHPYDKTIRPQVLREEQNPNYYKIIKEFEKLTGMGGILNTSFNLHGDPVVCDPADALRTFKNSGLEYLALENYLVSKIPQPSQLSFTQ